MELVYQVRSWRCYRDGNLINIFRPGRAFDSNFQYNCLTGHLEQYGQDSRFPKAISRFLETLGSEIDASSYLSNRKFGVEIECLHKTNWSIREDVKEELERIGIHCVVPGYTHEVMDCWKIVTDSSIQGGQGLEVVSPVLQGQSGLSELKKVLKVLNDLGCKVNKTTGLHVHHEARDLSREALNSIFTFYGNNESLFDSLVAPSRRGNENRFCYSIVGETFDSVYDRYHKVNPKSYVKYGTIEFRQHQGSLSYDKISHWIKLTQRVVERSNEYTDRKASSVAQLIEWMGLGNQRHWFENRVVELGGARA